MYLNIENKYQINKGVDNVYILNKIEILSKYRKIIRKT